MRPILPLLALSSLLLAGCDQLGIESASVTAEKRSAEGKAIGGACRHAARAIEDCYALNRRAEKASVYAGWREMDDYMRENKLEPVLPQLRAELRRRSADDEQTAAAEPARDEAAKGSHAKASH